MKLERDIIDTIYESLIARKGEVSGDIKTLYVRNAITKKQSKSVKEELNLSLKSMVFGLLFSEIKQSINKKILQEIFEVPAREFVNVRGLGFFSSAQKNVDFIESLDYGNLVVSGMVASEYIMDDGRFDTIQKTNFNSGGTVYSVGKVGNTTIWVDPYMKYNDSTVLYFNECVLEVVDMDWNIIENIHSGDYYEMTIDYKVSIDGKSKGFILNDMSTSGDKEYQEYLRIIRDEKLDELLDEE